MEGGGEGPETIEDEVPHCPFCGVIIDDCDLYSVRLCFGRPLWVLHIVGGRVAYHRFPVPKGLAARRARDYPADVARFGSLGKAGESDESATVSNDDVENVDDDPSFFPF